METIGLLDEVQVELTRVAKVRLRLAGVSFSEADGLTTLRLVDLFRVFCLTYGKTEDFPLDMLPIHGEIRLGPFVRSSVPPRNNRQRS